jgi:hypothetical protein
MQQTFYIDIDEEISSVIDRLNKSMAENNYFVVPARAIFMQSIVNLKLLKREADKNGKKVILVTQDEVGISMANRSGIEIRQTLEGVEKVNNIYADNFGQANYQQKDLATDIVESQENVKRYQDKQKRLKCLGSDDFYNSKSDYQLEEKNLIKKITINSGDHSLAIEKNRLSESYVDDLRRKAIRSENYKENNSNQAEYQIKNKFDSKVFSGEFSQKKYPDSHKEKVLEKMFSASLSAKKQSELSEENFKDNSKTKDFKGKKIFLIFGMLSVFAFALVVAYLFVPNAKVTIVPNISKNKLNINVHAVDVDNIDQSNMALRVIDGIEDMTATYKTQGTGATGGKKAHGSVVIYNEYNSNSQTLISTTRLESPDGKIFRLTKNIVIPGTTVVDGSVKPGAIEAEVIADQLGDDFNIEPTKFSIPGFSGSPKFDKFYAKSSIAFMGGSSEGGSGMATIISQQDIDNAKSKTENSIRSALNEKIKNELKQGEIALPQAEKITIIKSETAAKIGDVADSFVYTVEASTRALIFSEDDIKKITGDRIAEDSDVFHNGRYDISKIEYISIDPNFDDSTMDLKVNSEVTIIPDIDVEQIKKEILGKNPNQLQEILTRYPAIKSINLEFGPTFISKFISRISQYSQRVFVEIKNE